MVIIAGGEPVAYLALGLPDSIPMVAVANNILSPGDCSGLQRRARAAITGHEGSLSLLSPDTAHVADSLAMLRAHYGLDSAGACLDYVSSLQGAQLCPLKRVSAPPACR
jgi:hypothetical protein